MLWFYALAYASQAIAAVDDGTYLADFQDPPAVSRPKFRYWLPDPSVDVGTVLDDIRAAGSVGAGGIEFVPFYNYGGELDKYPIGADWSKYNFGTPGFKNMFRAALEAHKENGLSMDFAFGPSQGQGVPAAEDDEGLLWDLVRNPFACSFLRVQEY